MSRRFRPGPFWPAIAGTASVVGVLNLDWWVAIPAAFVAAVLVVRLRATEPAQAAPFTLSDRDLRQAVQLFVVAVVSFVAGYAARGPIEQYVPGLGNLPDLSISRDRDSSEGIDQEIGDAPVGGRVRTVSTTPLVPYGSSLDDTRGGHWDFLSVERGADPSLAVPLVQTHGPLPDSAFTVCYDRARPCGDQAAVNLPEVRAVTRDPRPGFVVQPSQRRDAVVRWTSPWSGGIDVTGRIALRRPDGGDGVAVEIRVAGRVVFTGAASGAGFADVQVRGARIERGDRVDVVVRGLASETGDATYVDLTYDVGDVVAPTVQPSTVQPSTVQPSTVQPSTVQPSVL